jgi:hypothetical protein
MNQETIDSTLNKSNVEIIQGQKAAESTPCSDVITREARKEEILKEEICKECDHDHSFRPPFDNLRTSIDIIPMLMKKLRQREQEEVLA